MWSSVANVDSSFTCRVYLAKWDPRDYAEPEAGQEHRIRDWIRMKYIEKRWHQDSNFVARRPSHSREDLLAVHRRGSYSDSHAPRKQHSHSGTALTEGSGKKEAPGSAATQTTKKNVDLLDLVFAPSSPEKPQPPPPPIPQASASAFDADPFASSSKSVSQSVSEGGRGRDDGNE